MREIEKIYQALNKIKIQRMKEAHNISARLELRTDENKELAEEAQNATCELSEEMDIGMSDLENAICEQSEMIEQALSDIENALCELTEE